MPYESKSQERWAHTPSGEKALGGPKKVAEWDSASKGKNLPEKKDDGDKGAPPKTYEKHEAREKEVMGAGYEAHEHGRSRLGTPHVFSKTHKAGKLRVSGHSGAHRIGKR